MKKTVIFLIYVSFCYIIPGLLFCHENNACAGQTYTLNLGFVLTKEDPMYFGAEALKTAVEKRTGGRLLIEIHPDSGMGDTQEIQELAKMGAAVGTISDPGRLGEMVPELGIMLAPYIADDYDELKTLSLSDTWKKWEEELAEQNRLRILAFNWYQGARHLLTNKPVSTPDDLKGVRMRTPGAPVWQESVRAMGAEPVAMAWAEVYPSLQLKVINGAEAQYPAIYGASLFKVVKYITKTSHFLLNSCVVVSEDWFQKLPKEYRDILVEEAVKAGDAASRLTLKKEIELEEKCKAAGVVVNEIDVAPFKRATAAVYNTLGYQETKKLVDKVLGRQPSK